MHDPLSSFRGLRNAEVDAVEACLRARADGIDRKTQMRMLQEVYGLSVVDALQTVVRAEQPASGLDDRAQALLPDDPDDHVDRPPIQFGLRTMMVATAVVAATVLLVKYQALFALVVAAFGIGTWLARFAAGMNTRSAASWLLSVSLAVIGNALVLYAPFVPFVPLLGAEIYDWLPFLVEPGVISFAFGPPIDMMAPRHISALTLTVAVVAIATWRTFRSDGILPQVVLILVSAVNALLWLGAVLILLMF
jgi:hypothetical protein